MSAADPDVVDLILRVKRLEKTLSTMAWWLVQAQTGFGERDARGIDDLLNAPLTPAAASPSPETDGEK